LAPRPTSKMEDHALSAVRDSYLMYSQLPSILGGRHLEPQPEEASCRCDKDPHNMDVHIRDIYAVLLVVKFLFSDTFCFEHSSEPH